MYIVIRWFWMQLEGNVMYSIGFSFEFQWNSERLVNPSRVHGLVFSLQTKATYQNETYFLHRPDEHKYAK